jgi:hypothetical protein
MLPIALAWGGFAARKTHLAKLDGQPKLKVILEKGRKNAIGFVIAHRPFFTLKYIGAAARRTG